MQKKLFALALLSATLATGQAYAADPSAKTETSYQSKDNGGFVAKDKSQSTDESGTTMTRETTKKVDVDADGNKEVKVESKTVTDPKGLFNKTSTEVENKAVEKDGVTEHSHVKKVDGKTVEEDKESQEIKR